MRYNDTKRYTEIRDNFPLHLQDIILKKCDTMRKHYTESGDNFPFPMKDIIIEYCGTPPLSMHCDPPPMHCVGTVAESRASGHG